MAAFTCLQIFLMIGMLVTGSINTLSKKAQNDCVVQGFKSDSHEFNHPWFQTWIMFIGESACLVGLSVLRRREWKEYLKGTQEANSDVPTHNDIKPPVHKRLFQWIVVIPTCCDLIGTSLAGVGLVYVDASVWQMMRGSIIIFAGVLSKIFLKRNLKMTHWLGMMIVMVGLVLVGCSSIIQNQEQKSTNGGKTILGIILILASQVVSAAQMVIEEAFLKNRNLHPLHVVGLEGAYGFLLMTFMVLPAMYFIPGSDVHNSYENSVDALYQISMSPRLLLFCLLYLASIAFYNYFGLAVTRSLTAVHRTLIDACRTILVWGIDLIIYYAFDKNFGEPFDKMFGLLQIDGFLFLMIGTAMYNQLLDLRNFVPCYTFQSEEMRDLPKEPVKQGNVQNDVSYSEEDTDDENTELLKGRR